MEARIIPDKILYFLAFDNDLYRELFSRSLCVLSGIAGLSRTTLESYLRGLTYRRLSNGKKIRVGRYVVFIGRERIQFDENVCLYGFSYLNAEGVGGYIRVGEQTHIDQFCVLYGQGGLEIGRFCAISSGVKIYSQSNQYKHDQTQKIIEQPVIYKKVMIGEDVWIGANAVILPGVQIGDSCIVGAGAVVKEDIPSYAIVAGIPAKIIGWRKSETVELSVSR